MRTISLRLRGTSTKELEEAGEDTTGVVESKSKLRTKIQGYTGIDILTDAGAYKSTYEILLEISKVWDDLTDQDRAGLLELIAGKTRSNTAAAILSNTEDLEEAYKSAMNAEGSALEENEKYLDSIQGRIDLFNNAIQTMWSTELDSDVIKLFVDLGTSLVKVIDKLGVVNTLVFGLMSYFSIFKKNKYDFASMLGIHSIEDGWFNKRKNKKNSSQLSTMSSTLFSGEQIDMFSDDIQTQSQINEKLNQIKTLKTEIKSLERIKWDDIKIPDDALEYKTGNRKRAYVNEVLIPNKQAEITAIQKDIDDITLAAKTKLYQSKAKLKEDADGQIMFDVDGTTNASQSTSKYFGIFERGLDKGATEKLTYDTKQLGIELDKLNGMDNAGIVNYMQNLDNLGDVGEDTRLTLAAYASTVKDGNYTLQGASQYVKDYNKNLAKLSKEATIAQFKQNMLNLAISVATALLSALIMKAINSASSAQDEFEELSSRLSSTNSELENINSELNETKERIEELQKQGSLSFTEQEELDRLKAQNDELERQKDLKESIQKQQQKGVNSETINAANDYYKKTGVKSGKTTREIAGQGAQYGVMIGGAVAAAGGATALASVLASSVAAFAIPVVGPILAGLLIAGTATAVAAGVGAAIGAHEEKVGESMDNMREQYAKLQEEYNAAQSKYANKASDSNYKKMQKAQEKLTEYESMMANHLSEMNAYYSQIDLSVYDPIEDAVELERLRKEMNDFYDTQDKWLIQSGSADAKSNAITRIFGENASDELKRIKREIQDAVTAENWDGSLNLSEYFNEADLDALTARLHEMGIYVYEVENYFKDMAEAEKEAAEVSLYDVATDIAKITDGLDSLKSAFDEVLESGSVTAKTLTELNEVFGTLGDSWDNYVNTMFSGVSSTKEMQEATEELAKAFIDSKILTGEAISEYERMSYIIQLRNMGVTNAEEYVDDKIQENAYKAIQNSVTYDETELKEKFNYDKVHHREALKRDLGITTTNFDKLSTEELEKLREYYNMSKEINAETAQKIADEYGIEINDEIINQLQKQIELKEKLANLEKKQAKKQEIQDELNKIKEVETHRQKLIDKYGHESDWVAGQDSTEDWDSAEDVYNYIIQDDQYANINKEEFINDYNAWKALLDENGPYSKLLTRKTELEAQLSELNLDPNVSQEEIEKVKSEIEAIDGKIETELTADIKLDIELQKKTDLVDQMQEVFDTLADAEKEYNENGGYVSVDTLQSLLQLEPKYLSMLYDENGQLNLNKEAILQVAQARTLDMGVQAAQNVIEQASEALAAGKIDTLKELTNITYNQADANWALVQSNLAALKTNIELANTDPTNAMYGKLDGVYEGVESQVFAIQDLTNKAIANIGNTFSSSGNTTKAAEKTALEQLQEKYERKISNLDNQQTYLENEIERLEAEDKVVSKSYYEKQIELEENKMQLLQQQRTELTKLLNSTAKGSDNWFEIADALWEVEHSIQESTLRTIEFRKSIGDLYKTAFEDLEKTYGYKDDVYSDRQAYIEKYMELLELQNGISPVSGYMAMIEQEEAKMANNVAKLNALRQALAKGLASGAIKEGTDVWVDMQQAIRDTEAAILDSKVAIERYKKEIKELWGEVLDGLASVYSSRGNLYSDRQNYIEKYMELLDLQGQASSVAGYMDMISEAENQIANSRAAISGLQSALSTGMSTGNIKFGDETWLKINEALREHEMAILDSKVAIEEYKNALQELHVEAFELVRTAFSNRNDYYANQQDYIEGYIDYLDTIGVDATPEIYEKLIEIEQQKRENNIQDLVSAREGLNDLEVAGYTAADKEWVDAYNSIVKLERGILDSEAAIQKWIKSIREFDFQEFDWFAESVSNLNKELDNVYKLVESKDVAFDDGTWTKEGITALSMLYHQIENNKEMIEKYDEEMAQLDDQYNHSDMSQKEYYERAEALKDGQWDLIHSNEDLKDSIIDINEARIDLVEEGISEEIEAYKELIDLRKKELESERD